MPLRALFPLDGSEPTYVALEHALETLGGAKDVSATLLVVVSKQLREMPEHAVEYLKYDDEDELLIRDDEAEAVLKKAIEVARRAKFPLVTKKIVSGNVFDAILQEAKSHDLLVMRGLSPNEFREKMQGRLTEKLTRHCPCHVMLVRT